VYNPRHKSVKPPEIFRCRGTGFGRNFNRKEEILTARSKKSKKLKKIGKKKKKTRTERTGRTFWVSNV
jgi:hypothetical protein